VLGGIFQDQRGTYLEMFCRGEEYAKLLRNIWKILKNTPSNI